jgi:hypothetical protein
MRGTPPHVAPIGRRPPPLLAFRTVRAIFYGYLTMIVTGIVYFSIVGLTHH